MQNRKRDTDVQNSLLDSVGEAEGGMFQENSIETCILSRVKLITSPGWMHETSAWTWCTGKTQRDRVEREVGGGIGMGNTCKPMAVSFQCMTKSTAIKKKLKKKKKDRDQFSLWHLTIQLFLKPFVEETIFSSLSTVDFLIKYELTVHAWIYFWAPS